MNMDVNGCAVILHLRLCLVLGVRGCGSVGDVEITNCGGRWEREGEREKNKREKGGERVRVLSMVAETDEGTSTLHRSRIIFIFCYVGCMYVHTYSACLLRRIEFGDESHRVSWSSLNAMES